MCFVALEGGIHIRDGHADIFADADIRIIRRMSDIARYMRRVFRIGSLSAFAWPSLVSIPYI